jgi:predicted CXXCH cytochrome family protein
MSNKSKKLLLVAAGLVCLLFTAAPAFAWTHGQFNATTDACAGCHVAHAAQAPKLLKTGPTQTEFCYLCHADGGASAPYDVRDGKTVVGANQYSSTAGGFERWWNGTGYATNTSRHNVWGLADESGPVVDDTYKYFVIPGGTSAFTGNGFVCGSCHNPHAGGKTPGTVSWRPPGSGSSYNITSAVMGNPRLLRTSIFEHTIDQVIFKMAGVGAFTYEGVVSGVYRVTDYVYGSAAWCGSCHNKFDTSTAGERIPEGGHAVEHLGMWRHPMDVHVTPPGGADTSLATGTPLEIWNRGASHPQYLTPKVACLTCHRAHGSTVSATGWASSWPRDSGIGGTSNTSALLRMDNRGACYNCHGAGEYNSWNDPRLNCGACHPDVNGLKGHSMNIGDVSCYFCHKQNPGSGEENCSECH